MDLLHELSYDECLERLSAGSVGRVALCTPAGPQIVPVNYSVVDDAVVFRTSPYGLLGTYGWNTQLAFEVDSLDFENRSGWSVVATGRGAMIDDAVEVARLRVQDGPRPWVAGNRVLHVRLRWRQLTGRRVGRAPVSSDSTG